MERQGKLALTTPVEPKPVPKSACIFVRVVYESMAGELLAVQVGPLTWQAADKLLGQYRMLEWKDERRGYAWVGRAGAIGAFNVGGETCSNCGAHASRVFPDAWLAARVVKFPSQYGAEGVVRVDVDAVESAAA